MSTLGARFIRRNKYLNVAVVLDGQRFASRKEAARWRLLRALEQNGHISDLKTQVTFPLIVNGNKLASYRADFVYKSSTGETVIEDVKGRCEPKDPVYRLYRLKIAILAATTGKQVTEIR